MRVTLKVQLSLVAFLLLLPPTVLYAHTPAHEDDLRTQIRADVMSSATGQLSHAELDALVESLAAEAEERGSAEDYLAARNAPDPSSEFATYETPLAGFPSRAIWISLIALALLVAVFVMYRRRQLLASD